VTDDYESPDDRKARVLAQVKAHPSYEAVKATKGGTEPSLCELDEYAEAQAFGAAPRAQKIQGLVQALLIDARHQAAHGSMVTLAMIKQLEAIAALLT
jgi:hypothetical protein